MKHNFHTHTSRCQHAVGTDEAYVEAALDAGFDVLGFADHAPFPFANGFVSGIRMPLDQLADYIHSVHALQQRYAGQLEIRLGLESEYFPRYHDHLLRMREQGIGYYILGQHYADSEEDNPYEKVAIELTESWNETEFDNIKNTITSLQKLGIKFYLDDFGTGYSNFERIIGLPIDVIKFDRSLTILAGKNAESRYMVGSFSDIFKNSHYEILFEGVENEKDEDQCKQMNALYLQGYKYSKPIPIEELTRFLGRAV